MGRRQPRDDEHLTLYHGTRCGEIDSFDGSEPPIYFTPQLRIAKQYAHTTILAGAQNCPPNARKRSDHVYRVSVRANPIDFRNERDRDLYVNFRRQWLETRSKDADVDDLHALPRIDREGFIGSHTGLPFYGRERAIMELFKKYGENRDSMWLDESSQGISLALFEPSHARIVEEVV